jgi:hypothetical protein
VVLGDAIVPADLDHAEVDRGADVVDLVRVDLGEDVTDASDVLRLVEVGLARMRAFFTRRWTSSTYGMPTRSAMTS